MSTKIADGPGGIPGQGIQFGDGTALTSAAGGNNGASGTWNINIKGTTGNGMPPGFPIPFYNSSAPPGWTKLTTLNDYMLRVTSGTGGGVGGTVPMSSMFTDSYVTLSGSTSQVTLNANQSGHSHTAADPGHSHPASGGGSHTHPLQDPGHNGHTINDPGHAHPQGYTNHTHPYALFNPRGGYINNYLYQFNAVMGVTHLGYFPTGDTHAYLAVGENQGPNIPGTNQNGCNVTQSTTNDYGPSGFGPGTIIVSAIGPSGGDGQHNHTYNASLPFALYYADLILAQR